MRKNQKYTKEEMTIAIELWQESGLSQKKFCKRENLSTSTFCYWLQKHRRETGQSKPKARKQAVKTFIPVEVSGETTPAGPGQIEITYPNGIQLSCPLDMDMQKIKTLLGI